MRLYYPRNYLLIALIPAAVALGTGCWPVAQEPQGQAPACQGGKPNGTCNELETFWSCPQDCPTTGTCGDGTCDAGEESSCPQDCPTTGTCGDGTCDAGEETTCAVDCPVAATCGDATCDVWESCESCWESL